MTRGYPQARGVYRARRQGGEDHSAKLIAAPQGEALLDPASFVGVPIA